MKIRREEIEVIPHLGAMIVRNEKIKLVMLNEMATLKALKETVVKQNDDDEAASDCGSGI